VVGQRSAPGYHWRVTRSASILPIPQGLEAPGTRDADYRVLAAVDEIAPGTMIRVTVGDHDVLLAHTERGICAIDDRCPHMSAPLSIGELQGCVVGCPLHRGRFDLATGETVVFPTTGGLDADGTYHPTWSPPGAPPKPEPADDKARARAMTRVRRLRYYPVRVREDSVEVALPTP
jgi:3-phenylpropionate/trans-cinnamate dioxygenase ferredoxin component